MNYDNFEARIAAKKVEQEKQPKAEALQPFPFTITLDILAKDESEAKETLQIVVEHLGKFDDLDNVKGVK